jgi:hypothetical protein
MKQVPRLRLIETKTKNTLRNNSRRKDHKRTAAEAGPLLADLKNSMTFFYLALENLKSSLNRPAVCAKKIEELKSLTAIVHAHMEKFLETLSQI